MPSDVLKVYISIIFLDINMLTKLVLFWYSFTNVKLPSEMTSHESLMKISVTAHAKTQYGRPCIQYVRPEN